VAEFLAALRRDAPPLAAVEDIRVRESRPQGTRGFSIVASPPGGERTTLISADSATCADCLRELFDPADRRSGYPFVNCTNCGPRFTIVRDVPYDRPFTTMAEFAMCADCAREYHDPGDRRFHAQPNACPACGPRARLFDRRGEEIPLDGRRDAIELTAERLEAGAIVAIKGLGGYHLACRADGEAAVAELRSRKHREDKPFALMAPTLEAARELAELGTEEEALMIGGERPIVIAPRRRDAAVAAAVAPRSRDLGVMLPYSPLHHLLLADCGSTLVMTSGNVSDEPIAYRDEEALGRLGGIADAFLAHDRPIHMRTDDSVLRSVALGSRREPIMLRRSRGYVPRSVDLPFEAPTALLGCGAELKNTFCLAKGRRGWVGHHIGDLENYETLTSFREGIEHFQRLFAVEPEVVAHDLHPDYLSTRYALEREGLELVGVQHHHAHFAACLAEHGEGGTAVGAIFDGTGYGPDGTVWGGELLSGDIATYERVGMLLPVRLPGGEAAIREPWRMACAWLAAAYDRPPPSPPGSLAGQVDDADWQAVGTLIESGLNSPLTSSVGRLFDAVAALCGIGLRVNYEGQAAAELEGAADAAQRDAYPLALIDSGGDAGSGPLILDPRETIRAVTDDLEAGVEPSRIGGRFHEALARATAQACEQVAASTGTDLVVLSGGVFQNRLLVERIGELLRSAKLRMLVPLRLPPNDGGISYGQVAVAAARLDAA
jgi:hydrogenase maturation protein HypF